MPDNEQNDRRQHKRIKVAVPVQMWTDAGAGPIRCSTSDLSLSGCYIETIFPFPVSTKLDLQLSIGTTVLIEAIVVTCDPQVGNGIKFIQMLPEDRDALRTFIEVAQRNLSLMVARASAT